MIDLMKNLLQRIKTKILIFMAVVGPGIITAVADNDAGGVATYTVGAAKYGMNSQFLIVPITILLALTQEIGSRISLVTRKGLADLIREKYGLRVAFIVFIFYFVVNQGVVIQNISGLKASLQIFQLPWQFFLIMIVVSLIFFVLKFNYQKIQRIFLFMIVFYISYVISAILAKPNWVEALRQSLIFPDLEYLPNIGYWFANIAILGTTITAWGQFFISSYSVDKKLTSKTLAYSKFEVYLGAFITNFFSWMMAAAVTYTLFVNNIRDVDGFNAGLAMEPFVGKAAPFLFGLGLFGASLLGLTIVPLATAYVFAEIWGSEGSLDASFVRGKIFYIFFIVQILIGLLVALYPNTSLFDLTLYVDFLNGAMLPIIFFFLIKFSEDEKLMGNYATRGFSKIFVRMSLLVILLAVIIIFISSIFGIN